MIRNTSTKSPTKVIIDCDPGVDDIIAILLALSSPEILIVAITLTHGNTTLPHCLLNLTKLFYSLSLHLSSNPTSISRYPGINQSHRATHGLGKIQVYLGSEGPIEGDAVTAKYFHGQDGLGDISTRHPELRPPEGWVSQDFELMKEGSTEGVGKLLKENEKEIAYLALGPVTSLAHLHKSTSTSPTSTTSILDSFSQILVMGGAVDAPGNTSPVAEFNTYADAYAASILYSLSLPHLYLFPLDITCYHTMPFPLYTSRIDPFFLDTTLPSQAEKKGELHHFTSSFLERTREVMKSFGEPDYMELHDPVVVWAIIEWTKDILKERGEGVEGGREQGWEWQRREFEVETTGLLTRGMLVCDRRSQTKIIPSQIPSIVGTSKKSNSTNRTKAIEELESRNEELMLSSNSNSTSTGKEEGKEVEFKGCKVIVSTTGPEKLREDLFRKIWGA